MTRIDMPHMIHDELIDLVLARVQEGAKMQAEVDALRLNVL